MWMIVSLIFTLTLLQHVFTLEQTINQDMPQPKYHQYDMKVDNLIDLDLKLLTFTFPNINFEISGQFYTQASPLSAITNDSVHNKKFYDNTGRQSCQYYGTDLKIDVNSTIYFKQRVLQHFVTDKQVYIVRGDSQFVVHQYNLSGLKFKQSHPLNPNIARIQQHQLSQQIHLIKIKSRILLFNSNSAWLFNQERLQGQIFQEVVGFQLDNISKIGIVDKDNIWIATQTSLYIYTVSKIDGNKLKLTLNKQFLQLTHELIADLYFDQQQNNFYLLQLNKLLILSRNSTEQNFKDNITTFLLNGEECQSFTKYKSTIYVSCQQDRVNFIAELRIQIKDNILRINRYYDDNILEGIQKVQILHYDKIALVGEQEVMVLGEAVNRNTLLQLHQRNGKLQTSFKFYSYGLLDMYSIVGQQASNVERMLVINQESIELYRVIQNPPEVQCIFNREKVGPVVLLLVAFNTTHCSFSQGDPTTVGGSESLCQTLYPIEIVISVRQLQNKTAKLIMLSVSLFLIVLTLICVGCGVKIRNGANKAIATIKMKIHKLKNPSQGVELKKI